MISGNRLRAVLVLFAAMLAPPLPALAQGGDATIWGRVVDATTLQPVADAVVMVSGIDRVTTTDQGGFFSLRGVAHGRRTLRVSHLAYGEHTQEVTIGPEDDAFFQVHLSPTAIRLEPISVEARSATEARIRASGTHINRITRDVIELAIGSTMNMADVLRQQVAGITVRRIETFPGSPICVEFRGAARNAALGRGCRSPAVFIDGIQIANPTSLYGSMDLSTVESMEVVPIAEASTRFGSNGAWGAVLIESRRPGLDETNGDRLRDALRDERNFDWSVEPRGHRSTRVFASSFAGSALGLALGLVAANQCIRVRAPSYDAVVTDCGGWVTLGTGLAAITLPALGSSFAAGLAGRTDLSQGKLLPAAAGAAMMLIPGYALLISSRRDGSDGVRAIGIAFLTVGAPAAATIADYLFRKLRNEP